MSGPLAGYRVVDHGEFITAPYAAMLLGDLGAEVVKVERPGGDRFRHFEHGSYGPQFQAFNRNKKSLVLDLERDDERATLHDLLRTADVYIHNFRPGVAERLGAGADAAHAINPRLVYCAISGFGPDGPYAQRPAYDTVGQALSGFLSMFVDPSSPRIVGPATADSVSGLYAANGILAALLERGRTGRGRCVHVPMVAAMAHFSIEQYHRYFATGEVPGPSDRGRVAQSFALRCADGGLIAIHLSSPPKFWTGLLAAIERPDLASDPRFAGRVAFVEDYDINVARHMVQGVDVWLNNPRRPLEASGTSGEKVVLNGGLNLSVLDGWWAEAYDGKNGFAIGNGSSHVSYEINDQRDAEDLHRVLKEQVIPLYYERDVDGLPRGWIKRMMNSISSLAWRFSAHRMVMDYVKSSYLTAAGGVSCDMSIR